MNHFAVLAQIAILELGAVGAGHYLTGNIQSGLPVFRVHQILHGLAHHLLLGETEYAFAGGGYILEAAVFIDHADNIEQQIEKLGERGLCEMVDHCGYLPAQRRVQARTSIPCSAM